MYTYANNKRNSYSFDKKESQYILKEDSISFTPDDIIKIAKGSNTKDYRMQLQDRVVFYLKKMDHFKIKDVTSEFMPHGINLKFYMNSEAILLYVAYPKNVINPQWINYLNSMDKFDDNWYYSRSDK